MHRISLSQWTRLVAFLGAIAVNGYAAMHVSLSVAVLYLILGVAGVLIVYRGGRNYVRLFTLTYHLTLIVAIAIYAIYSERWGQPYFGGGSDDRGYERSATLMAESDIVAYNRDLIANQIGNPFHNSVGYVYLISYLIRFGDLLGGYDTMLPRVLNAFLLALCAILTAQIAKQIGLSPRRSIIAGLWVALHPMMLFASAHVFRDTLTALLLLLTLNLATVISMDRSRSRLFRWLRKSSSLLVLIPVMASLRLLYLIPMLGMTLVAWAFRLLRIRRIKMWHIVGIVPVAVAGFLVVAPRVDTISKGLSALERYRSGYVRQAATPTAGLSAELFTLPEPIQTVGRIGYAILTPLPILYKNIEWNLLGAAALVQFLFAAYVFLGITMIYRYTALMPLLLGFVILFASYALGTFTFRHITQWYPLAVLIGMVGYLRYVRYRYVILGGALYSAAAMAAMYVSIKVLR